MLNKYLYAQDNLSEFIGRTVSWLCLLLMGILLYEVVARYFFNAPTIWAHDLSTMVYGTFCILAGAYTHKHKGHVNSAVVYSLFPKRGQIILDIITGLLGLIIFSIFFTVVLDFAIESWNIREVSSKSQWAPPIYPFKMILPIAVALLFLQSLSHLIRDLCSLFNIKTD